MKQKKRRPGLAAAGVASGAIALSGTTGIVAYQQGHSQGRQEGFENGRAEGLDIGKELPTKVYRVAMAPPGATPEKDNAPYSLQPTSPAVDEGLNDAVPEGILWDIRGEPYARIVDGDGDGTATVDMGAYELQAWQTAVVECAADLTGDGQVNSDDLFIVLGDWGPCDPQ